VSRFATPAELRDFMEWSGTTGRKSDVNLGLLLDAASDFLEHSTGRMITSTGSNYSRTYSSKGRAIIPIGDWRTVDQVTLNGADLTPNSSYWLIESRQSADVSTSIQLRTFGSSPQDARSGADWFDTNKDSWLWPGNWASNTQPNDLVITGLGGWTEPPPIWKLTSLVLAGYYYHHADAAFSGARQTPEGNVYDLSRYPVEVQKLVSDWTLGEAVVIV